MMETSRVRRREKGRLEVNETGRKEDWKTNNVENSSVSFCPASRAVRILRIFSIFGSFPFPSALTVLLN